MKLGKCMFLAGVLGVVLAFSPLVWSGPLDTLVGKSFYYRIEAQETTVGYEEDNVARAKVGDVDAYQVTSTVVMKVPATQKAAITQKWIYFVDAATMKPISCELVRDDGTSKAELKCQFSEGKVDVTLFTNGKQDLKKALDLPAGTIIPYHARAIAGAFEGVQRDTIEAKIFYPDPTSIAVRDKPITRGKSEKMKADGQERQVQLYSVGKNNAEKSWIEAGTGLLVKAEIPKQGITIVLSTKEKVDAFKQSAGL